MGDILKNFLGISEENSLALFGGLHDTVFIVGPGIVLSFACLLFYFFLMGLFSLSPARFFRTYVFPYNLKKMKMLFSIISLNFKLRKLGGIEKKKTLVLLKKLNAEEDSELSLAKKNLDRFNEILKRKYGLYSSRLIKSGMPFNDAFLHGSDFVARAFSMYRQAMESAFIIDIPELKKVEVVHQIQAIDDAPLVMENLDISDDVSDVSFFDDRQMRD